MTCKGICTRHKAIKPRGAGRYATGQKRCQICNIFIKWEGLYCPCCGYRVRSKPRHLKYKEKFRAHMASAIEAEPSITRDADVDKQETLTPVATA
ncbi:MAG: hypothetical protein M3247_04425, partial [Thermoproteota archaeon]|jgi:hypothetical protein|nr:hypothetical protein [Thermoproteota archaeon]